MDRKLQVGLVYGGKSGEHEVSLQTALAVINAFDFGKYEIVPFYITKQGEWQSAPKLLAPLSRVEELQFSAAASGQIADASAGAAGEAAAEPVSVQQKESASAGALVPIFGHLQEDGADASQTLDVVFPLLHGTFGEDGTIQGLLEMANIPYVGAGVLASAVGMDKVMMKRVFAQEGLPQCIYRHFTRNQWQKDRSFFLMEIEVAIGYPCFVKPANLGSSVGISKARNREEFIEAVEFALRYDRKVIVEENIDAREIEVSVLGNDEPKASVPGEIVSSNEFYDYKAKYTDGKSAMVIPAEIPDELAAQLRELAVRAFQAIDGSGLSRVDFFVRKDNGQILINEVNTMPGFTPFSMYPLLWKETGLSYRELLDELIRLAIARHKEKQLLQYGE